MRKSFKFTKSVIINSILSTFLLVMIVSCKSSHKSRSISQSGNNNSSQVYSNNDKADKVLKTAKLFIGTRYKYGGTSRNGMDCSGLVYTAFQSANIQLPRTSAEQSKSGKSVSIKELEPGDLVFFTDKRGHKKITHVGIITEVNGGKNIKFIHASTKLGVVENDLFAEYYISIFIKATRVL